jgi:hypothetical protein
MRHLRIEVILIHILLSFLYRRIRVPLPLPVALALARAPCLDRPLVPGRRIPLRVDRHIMRRVFLRRWVIRLLMHSDPP